MHRQFTKDQRLAAKGVGIIMIMVGIVFGVALGSEVWLGVANVWDAEGTKRVPLTYRDKPERFIIYVVSRSFLSLFCIGVGLLITLVIKDKGKEDVDRHK